MENKEIEIKPDKMYSIRETAKLLPWIKCEPTLQKLIMEDIEKNKNQLYKTIVLKRKKNNRYYIKGSTIIELIKNHKDE